MTPQRRLYFGGSFNPVHHGHLTCARAVAEAGGFGRVVLVPSARPPHKPGSTDLANPADRLAMCRLAVAEDPLFDVDDLELARTGPSYTIDTARALRDRGENSVHWLIGADMLIHLPKWHEPEALLREVSFVAMARPGWTFDWRAMPQSYRALRDAVVEAPLIDISATDLRARVARHQSIAFLTPPAVCRYIQDRGLYRTGAPAPPG